jgi:excinuclease ABC subunit B
MAEDLADYLSDVGVKARYLHADIDTIERSEILRALRLGEFDVLIGINLLREGLDLPEVSLVAILDADKEGFLRSETALTQTIGRAARHMEGKVIMYAERITNSMERAIETTNERRIKQMAYNKAHGITPTSIQKRVRDLYEDFVQADEEMLVVAERGEGYTTTADLPKAELQKMISDLEKQMKQAAQALEFERAADLRDQIMELRQMMAMKEAGVADDAPVWEKERKLRKSTLRYDTD